MYLWVSYGIYKSFNIKKSSSHSILSLFDFLQFSICNSFGGYCSNLCYDFRKKDFFSTLGEKTKTYLWLYDLVFRLDFNDKAQAFGKYLDSIFHFVHRNNNFSNNYLSSHSISQKKNHWLIKNTLRL